MAGGVCFSYMVEETLAGGNVDFVVRGEGEATLVDLMRALLHGRPVDGIAGLAWQGGTRVRVNPLRPPIVCPDDLPRPAYDLLQLGAYGRGSRNHPRPATLEHGRGCIDRCSFCILWKHFGAPRNGSVVPCYRTKSPERAAAEVEWLARDHGRRTIHFVDPTFNVSSQWSDRFADLVLAAGLDVQFTAWMRADGILRDEENGVLEKLVRAGLVQVYVGVERDDDRELARLNKHNNGPDVTRKAFEVLRTRYPGVFTIGTIIYGMPWESEATLRRLRDFHLQCPMDYAFHIPLAPNPGTDIRDDLLARGYALSDDLRDYNFLTPVADTDHLTRRELEQFYSRLLFHLSPAKLSSLAAKWHPRRSARVRRVQRDLLVHGLEVGARQLARCLLGAPDGQPTLYARKPRWYDS